jgi:hypothetical protein
MALMKRLKHHPPAPRQPSLLQEVKRLDPTWLTLTTQPWNRRRDCFIAGAFRSADGVTHDNIERKKSMADNSTTTITAKFDTRADADLAVEHLVQQHGISRPDIFIQASGDRNTAGSAPSGGDVAHEEGTREDGALEGEIEVSVDISDDQVSAVQRSLSEAGAIRMSGR